MSAPLTKLQILDRLGIRTSAELATWFGITPPAVSQWPEDQPIPIARWHQAQLKRPDLFRFGPVVGAEENGDDVTSSESNVEGAQDSDANVVDARHGGNARPKQRASA